MSRAVEQQNRRLLRARDASAPPAADVALVIDAASCPEHEPVLLLAADGGLRNGEIRALRCGDCEMANQHPHGRAALAVPQHRQEHEVGRRTGACR